jgi:hypothetical protein
LPADYTSPIIPNASSDKLKKKMPIMAKALPRNTTEKITISLPRTLAERFSARVPPRQRSTFIAEILEERLAIEEQLQAFDESAGCWSNERHPDMATGEDIDDWLATLRGRWRRQGGDC